MRNRIIIQYNLLNVYQNIKVTLTYLFQGKPDIVEIIKEKSKQHQNELIFILRRKMNDEYNTSAQVQI